MTTFSDQVYQYGGAPVNGAMTTGNVFFVSSVTGSDANTGKKPSQPFATLDKATNACTANKNDIVYIMPNHAETISTATSWVPDIAGVQYIGIGLGADAPELTFSATGSTIAVTGANSLFKNIRFVAGISAVVAGVTVTGNHVTFDGCTWDFSTTAFDFVWMLSIDSADYTVVKNCRFIAENATAGSAAAIRLDASDQVIIKDNFFTGDYSGACILSASTEAAGKSLMIVGNNLYNDDTASTYGGGIALRVAHTGMIANNMVAWLSGTGSAGVPYIDPGSCLMFENYVATAVDEYGVATLVGTATT